MRAAKVQASLRIRAVSPEPPLLAHTSSESRGTFRQKARSLALLNGWACAVKICHDGMLEDTNSLGGAQLIYTSYTCIGYRRIKVFLKIKIYLLFIIFLNSIARELVSLAGHSHSIHSIWSGFTSRIIRIQTQIQKVYYSVCMSPLSDLFRHGCLFFPTCSGGFVFPITVQERRFVRKFLWFLCLSLWRWVYWVKLRNGW